MIHRRIIRLGKSTLVVSLPKDWIEVNRLRWHDSVVLTPQMDGSIAVYPENLKKKPMREITLVIDPKDEVFLYRKITACYLSGYSSIKLISKGIFTDAQRRTIRDLCHKLYMRVMDASANEIRVESLVELSKVPVDTGVRRMCQIALGMCKDSLRAFNESDKALGNAVISIDDEVDNFSLLLLRLIRSTAFDITLASQLGLRIIDCFDYTTVVQNIERVADCAVNIARCVQMRADDNKQFSPRKKRLLTKLGSEAFNAYEMAVGSFFARDMEAANRVAEVGENLARSLEETIGSIAEEKQSSPLFHLYIAMNSLHRIAQLGHEIAEATMNSAVCKLENKESR